MIKILQKLKQYQDNHKYTLYYSKYCIIWWPTE